MHMVRILGVPVRCLFVLSISRVCVLPVYARARIDIQCACLIYVYVHTLAVALHKQHMGRVSGGDGQCN